jgi:hypothetical protein
MRNDSNALSQTQRGGESKNSTFGDDVTFRSTETLGFDPLNPIQLVKHSHTIHWRNTASRHLRETNPRSDLTLPVERIGDVCSRSGIGIVDSRAAAPNRSGAATLRPGHRGNRTVNAVPSSTEELTSIVPPCALTMRSAI